MRYIVVMRIPTGRCLGAYATPNKSRERKIDPLWHILLHERGGVSEVDMKRYNRRQIVTLVEHYSGEPCWRYIGHRPRPSESVYAWVDSTEHVLEWLKSPRALRAPSYWPEEVESLFGHSVPEPWEIANSIPMCFNEPGPNPSWYGHDISTLVSYTCGLSIYEMSKIVGVNERAVISHMQSGVRRLVEMPQFKLWCLNLDWRNIMGIALQGHDYEKKQRFFEELEKTPLGLSKRDVDKAMESIVFKFGAESSMTPKRQTHRPIYKHVMICEPR